MKLKRFKTDNIHKDYTNKQTQYSIINESVVFDKELDNKITKIKYISENWNDEMSAKFTALKSMYYLGEEELSEVISQFIHKTNKNTELTNTLNELLEKYKNHEAIKDIRIVESDIVIDLLCDTDIEQSCLEYNGVKLIYNKICEIKSVDTIIKEKLEEQAILLNEAFNSFFYK